MLGTNYFSYMLNPRISIMLIFGFASGLPLALTGSTLQAWFTDTHINLMTIGTLSLIGMPYVFKFLWAPLFDRFAFPFADKRRSWIIILQLGLCVAVANIAMSNPLAQPLKVGIFALAIAFLSASQDIVIDAYRSDLLLPEERALGSAYFIFAYRVALLISGGMSLVLAEHLGWQNTYFMMALLIGSMSFVTYFAPAVKNLPKASHNLKEVVVNAYAHFLKQKAIGLILLFVLSYKLGDALAFSLMSNFLLHGLGFTLTEVGVAYKAVGFIATIAGAIAGGVWWPRLGCYKALLLFGMAQALAIFFFILLALVDKSYGFLLLVMFIENFCSGMSTAAFMAFLMMLCQKQYSATQFASLSALASLGRVLLGPLASVLVMHVGWANFFGYAFLLALPGLMVLILLRNKVKFDGEMA